MMSIASFEVGTTIPCIALFPDIPLDPTQSKHSP
jgi:hypothetical protein